MNQIFIRWNRQQTAMFLPDQEALPNIESNGTSVQLKILVINYEFPPLGGGAGRGTYNLARELAKKGHKVDVLTSRAVGFTKKEKVEGFHVYRVKSWRKGIHDCGFRGALSFLLFAIPVFLHLTRKNNYDFIHYFFSLPTGLLRFVPGKHRTVPYVVSLRGSDVPGYDGFNRSLQSVHRFLLPVTRNIWRGAARVVALSSDLRNSAQASDELARIDVIPNGIESELFVFDASIDKSAPTIELICVARLIERKGVQHILHALCKLPNSIALTVVGEGNYMRVLQDLTTSLGLDNRVHFYGYCPREKLVQLYNRSDIFVLPSMAESFGMVFVEAMSCGLPVIGARVGGVPDIVKEENGVLVTPDSVDDVVAAVKRLAGDAPLRQSMAKENRAKAVEQYAWSSVADAYELIYHAECAKGFADRQAGGT